MARPGLDCVSLPSSRLAVGEGTLGGNSDAEAFSLLYTFRILDTSSGEFLSSFNML